MRGVEVFVLGVSMAWLAGCGGTAVAPIVMSGGEVAPDNVEADDPAFARQLAGHLRRVEGCFARGRGISGLVEVSFTALPSGHLEDVVISRDTSSDTTLGECVRSRLTSLYFDPAPRTETRKHHRFAFCDADDAALCVLGPPEPVDATAPNYRAAIEDLFRGQSAQIAACQASTDGDALAIVEVEVTIGVDGRVMSGRITDSVPVLAPVARCALRPLLGTHVTDEPPAAPTRYRRTILLRPTEAPLSAALSPR